MVKFALNQNSEKFEILENLNEIHKKACILASIYDFFVDRNKHIITGQPENHKWGGELK